MNTPQRIGKAVVAGAVCSGLLATGTGTALAQPDSAVAPGAQPGRGTIVKVTGVRKWSVDRTSTYLKAAKFDPQRVRFGVELDQVRYRTIDPDGHPTLASGLVVLPLNGRRDLSLVSYTHGTTSYRPDVPSTLQDDTMSGPGIAYAAAGFASASPDYLGLGDSPGKHPWMDISSETTASVDMLKAARTLAHQRGRALDRSVYVTGFSQGASAALGVARALQDGADPRSRVAAIAPLSGAYAFRRAEIPAILKGDELNPKMSVAYLSYLLVARNRFYHFYKSPDEVFAAKYAGRVEQLFSGSVPGPDMLNSLPDDIDQLLRPEGLAMVRNPTGRFRASLREIDSVCSGWQPHAPTRLFYVPGDEQAANANTAVCRQQFRGTVPAVALPDYQYDGSRHIGTVITGVAATLDWFERLDRSAPATL